jgi:hypothetical protein
LINKILFTIFAVIAIWKAFSYLSKLSKSTGTSPAKSEPPNHPSTGQPSTGRAADPSIELVPCRRCGAYVDPKEGCRCTTSST